MGFLVQYSCIELFTGCQWPFNSLRQLQSMHRPLHACARAHPWKMVQRIPIEHFKIVLMAAAWYNTFSLCCPDSFISFSNLRKLLRHQAFRTHVPCTQKCTNIYQRHNSVTMSEIVRAGNVLRFSAMVKPAVGKAHSRVPSLSHSMPHKPHAASSSPRTVSVPSRCA